MSKVKISKYLMLKIRKFAHQRVNGSKDCYAYRGEANVSKIEEDIIIGAMGEYAVHNMIKGNGGLKCSKPDLKIYEKRRKSFDADLTAFNKVETFKIHVKSQSLKSEKRYGQSYLFQRSDKLISSPKVEDVMAFCTVDVKNETVEVVGFVNSKIMIDMQLMGECEVPRYRHSKVAVYLKDLEPYGIIMKEL